MVELLASKYSFDAEEAQEFIRRTRRQPKLKIVEEAPKLRSILRRSWSKKKKMHRVKFEYGCKSDESVDEPLEEYEPPEEHEETNEKYPLLL